MSSHSIVRAFTFQFCPNTNKVRKIAFLRIERFHSKFTLTGMTLARQKHLPFHQVSLSPHIWASPHLLFPILLRQRRLSLGWTGLNWSCSWLGCSYPIQHPRNHKIHPNSLVLQCPILMCPFIFFIHFAEWTADVNPFRNLLSYLQGITSSDFPPFFLSYSCRQIRTMTLRRSNTGHEAPCVKVSESLICSLPHSHCSLPSFLSWLVRSHILLHPSNRHSFCQRRWIFQFEKTFSFCFSHSRPSFLSASIPLSLFSSSLFPFIPALLLLACGCRRSSLLRAEEIIHSLRHETRRHVCSLPLSLSLSLCLPLSLSLSLCLPLSLFLCVYVFGYMCFSFFEVFFFQDGNRKSWRFQWSTSFCIYWKTKIGGSEKWSEWRHSFGSLSRFGVTPVICFWHVSRGALFWGIFLTVINVSCSIFG